MIEAEQCHPGSLVSFPSVHDAPQLTDLERELLELCGMSGETTTLDEEMVEDSPGQAVVEATLQGLVERGLMTRERGLSDYPPRATGSYEDDWWDVTAAGREAAGLPRRQSLSG